MPCCDTDGPQKHQKLRPVTDTAHNRRCSSLWKRAGWTHVHIWCAHVAAHSCVFVCWYVRTFPMFTRPPLQQETHVFSWQGWGEPGGATAAQRKQRRKAVCCCRLRQRGSAEGAQGSDVKVIGVFSYARWRESVRGTCAVDGECVRVLKSGIPVPKGATRFEWTMSSEGQWSRVCESDH